MRKYKKKELVDIDINIPYYHKKGAIEPRYIKETITRKEAEEKEIKPCFMCFK